MDPRGPFDGIEVRGVSLNDEVTAERASEFLEYTKS